MAKFVLGRSFEPENNGSGVRRYKIDFVKTRHGLVLAYENMIDGKPGPITVCPGLYDKELPRESCTTEAEIFLATLGRPLPPPKLYRTMNLNTVPEEYRRGVKKDLRKARYRGEIKW